MISFANRYRAPTSIRQNRPLTNDELQRIVPSAFSAEKHESRSDRYTYIRPLKFLIACVKKGSSLIMPRSHEPAMLKNVSSPNTYYACVATIKSRVKKSRKLFC